MSEWDTWVREDGTVDAFCPIEADGSVVVGMTIIGDPPGGRVVGTFAFTDDGDINVTLYEGESL